MATIADFLMLPLLVFNSCLYFARKCMVSSIEIPKAILKTKMVDGLMGIPTSPIIAEVIINGIKFEAIKIEKPKNKIIEV